MQPNSGGGGVPGPREQRQLCTSGLSNQSRPGGGGVDPDSGFKKNRCRVDILIKETPPPSPGYLIKITTKPSEPNCGPMRETVGFAPYILPRQISHREITFGAIVSLYPKSSHTHTHSPVPGSDFGKQFAGKDRRRKSPLQIAWAGGSGPCAASRVPRDHNRGKQWPLVGPWGGGSGGVGVGMKTAHKNV